MKRSEMVLFMHQACHGIQRANDGRISHYELMDKLLSLMEDKGMMPPFSGKIKQVNIENRWGVKTGEQKARVIVNEWEDE